MSPPSQERMPSEPSYSSRTRKEDARDVLRLMQDHNPSSKAELVQLSGLRAAQVASGISHLEALGLVERIPKDAPIGRRTPELLRFKAMRGYVAAADIGGTRLRMMLADLGGRVLGEWSMILGARQKTPAVICNLIAKGIAVMCAESGLPMEQVLHLTAGAPGITNVTDGVVISAPNLVRWKNVPLRTMLETKIGIPCNVDNDTNLAAVGEYWRGAARGIDNFVFIALGTGVGAGIFLRGQLHHGAHWTAGEIGYFGVSGKKRETMKLHETGQLERVIAGEAIEEEWMRVLKRDPACSSTRLNRLKAPAVFDLAKAGDSRAVEVLQRSACALADAIADISFLLNPQIVILGGGVGSHDELRKATEKLLRLHESAPPELYSSALGTQAQLYGAIRLSLHAVAYDLL